MQVIIIIKLKRQITSTSSFNIIVLKLDYKKEFCSVILLLVDENF